MSTPAMSGRPGHERAATATLRGRALPAPRTRSARALRWVDVLSASVLVLALGLLGWPLVRPTTVMPKTGIAGDDAAAAARASARASAPASTPATSSVPVVDMARADSLAQRAVAANVFSASRRAPVSRFVMPGQPSSVSPTMVPSMLPDSTADAATLTGEVFPRLTGIVVMNGERLALLQLSANDGSPRLYRAGEQHGRVRVVRIEATHVLLSGPAGSRVLRLDARATPDSLEILP